MQLQRDPQLLGVEQLLDLPAQRDDVALQAFAHPRFLAADEERDDVGGEQRHQRNADQHRQRRENRVAPVVGTTSP